MTLADVLKTSITILAHQDITGTTIGAGAGALIAIPTLSINPSLINPSEAPYLVAIANASAVGAVIGGSIATAACAVKIYKLDKQAIKDRAETIIKDVEQKHLGLAALDGAVIGLGVAVNRFYKLSKANGTHFCKEAFSKTSVWEAFGFSVLGASVGVGVLLVGKYAHKKLIKKCGKASVDDSNVEDVGKDDTPAIEDVAQAATETVNDAVAVAESSAQDAAATAKDAAETAKDAAKEAMEKASAAAADAVNEKDR